MADDSDQDDDIIKCCSVRTSLTTDWSIREFKKAVSESAPGEHFKTRVFLLGPHSLWMRVYPNGTRGSTPGHLAITLERDGSSTGDIVLSGSIVILYSDARLASEGLGIKRAFIENTQIGPKRETGWEHFARIRDLEMGGFTRNDTLRVRLNLEVCEATSSPITQKTTATELSRIHFGDLLASGIKSDVILVADGKEFPAHWNILSCRSKYFERMLQAGLSETSNRRIELQDTDSITMAALLQFLYTGSVNQESVISSPEGRWVYGDVGLDFMISNDSGELSWRENKRENNLSGKLKEVAPNEWSLLLDSGERIELALRKNTMASTFYKPGCSSSVHHVAQCPSVMLEFWSRLLRAADRYCMADLMDLCDKSIGSYLWDLHSAATILRIANSSNRRDLKDTALSYMTCSEARMRAVQQMSTFDTLDPELAKEVYEFFFNRERLQKRDRVEDEALQFPNGSNWERLSNAQLRQACAERDFPTGGNRDALVALLVSQE